MVRACIHAVGGRPLSEECATALRGFEKLGVECVLFSDDGTLRQSRRENIVVGGMLVTGQALAARCVVPPSVDYPKPLAFSWSQGVGGFRGRNRGAGSAFVRKAVKREGALGCCCE